MSQKQLYLSLYINLCYLLDDIVPPLFHKNTSTCYICMYISSVYSVSPESNTGGGGGGGGCFPPSLEVFC